AGFVDKEIDVALALAIGSLNREDLERAEQYARVATHLGPDVPQSWLMLGQALHVRGFREVRVGDRMDLLQAARTHYSKVIELASKQGSVHIEAIGCLNRGIVRDLLSDPSAEEDFIAARQLVPGDADIARRHAFHLAELGQLDRAVEVARSV